MRRRRSAQFSRHLGFAVATLVALLLIACSREKTGHGGGTPATTVPSEANFRAHPEHDAYMRDYLAWKRGKPVELIFIGDSITEMWRWGPGHYVWQKHFEDRAIAFGLGGDRTQEVLWRLHHYDLSGWSPRAVVVLVGANNTEDKPADIAAGVQAVLATAKRTFPGAKIVVVSILPNAVAPEKMAAANSLIAKLGDDRSVFYLDLAAKFPREGNTWRGLGPDRLHLSPEGYAVFAEELEQVLGRLDHK